MCVKNGNILLQYLQKQSKEGLDCVANYNHSHHALYCLMYTYVCVYQLFIAIIVLHNEQPPTSLVNNRKLLFSSSSTGFSLGELGSLMNLRLAQGYVALLIMAGFAHLFGVG